MKKNTFLVIIIIILTLTGCTSEEEKKEIVQNSNKLMTDYLQKYYEVDDVMTTGLKMDSTFGADFDGVMYGQFTINKKNYNIVCSYYSKECYDEYTFEFKIKPILIDAISSINNNLKIQDIDYSYDIKTAENYKNMFNKNVFSADIPINSTDDMINFMTNIKGIEFIKFKYYSNEKMIENQIEEFKKIINSFNEYTYIYADTYSLNNDHLEELSITGYDKYAYYYYQNKTLPNFKVKWASTIKSSYDLSISEANFDATIINNDDKYFDDTIIMYKQEYYLYDNNILKVTNIKPYNENDNSYDANIEININDSTCNKAQVLYKEENEYRTIHNGRTYTFYHSDSKNEEKFAIYCRKN